MNDSAPLTVHFQAGAFVDHWRSGISRYFAELIAAFDAESELGIQAVTPYTFVTNDHLAELDRRFYRLPLPRRFRRPVLNRLNRRRLTEVATVDVTHYPLYDPEMLPSLGATPSVTTVYDFTFEMLPESFGDLSVVLDMKRRYLEACDVLVCISQATQRDLRRFHPDLDKPTFVTPLAVSERFFNPGGSRLGKLPERYVLHVGSRIVHKNLDLVLEAFGEVAQNDPTLHLVLCGAGGRGEEARWSTLDFAERIHVVRIGDGDLPAVYAHALALFFPSRYEGFGLPVLEAMAAGCPVITSDVPALVEVGSDAVAVVDPDDREGAAAILEQIVRDPVRSQHMRERGRARAVSYGWARTARLTAEAYREATRQ